MKQVMLRLEDDQATSLALAAQVAGVKKNAFIAAAIEQHVATVKSTDEFKAAVKQQQATLAGLLK